MTISVEIYEGIRQYDIRVRASANKAAAEDIAEYREKVLGRNDDAV